MSNKKQIQNSKFKLQNLGLLVFGFVLFSLAFTSVSLNAASFDFNPSTSQLLAGCRSAINIDANVSGQTSNAADIEVQYNPAEIDILDSNPNIPGTQIKSGNAYETYFGNEVTPSLSRIRLAGASFVGNLTTRKTFATIEFQSRPGVTSTSFQIRFTGVGATLDSNIADSSTSDDLLSSVTNGNYTFRTDFCQVDREPPRIINQSPTAYATGVAANAQVRIQITDNQAGVDLANTRLYINNDEYLVTDPAVSYTGSALNYSFVITPRNPIPTDVASTIRVVTQDLVGNKSNNSIVFNIPPSIIEQVICPAYVNPNGATGVGGIGGGNTLPQTGGTIRTGGYSPELINALKEELDDEKSANSLLGATPLDGSFWNDLFSKPIIGNLDKIKSLEASLKALQYFSLFSLAILIFLLLNLLLSGNKREIRGYALNGSKKPVAGTLVELFNLVDNLKAGHYYSENDGEYIFKVDPGAYEVKFVDNGKYFTDNVIVPEILQTTFLGKNLSLEKENKYLQIFAQLWFVVKVGLTKLYPGVLLVGTIIALINLYILPTWFNVIIFVVYIAIIASISIPKLVRYISQSVQAR